jgi:L-seryl-tRNA(Ser) seleniumtransferase
VGPAVFNTDETSTARLAGSIPVRLRQSCTEGGPVSDDPRRAVPRTDEVLASDVVRTAAAGLHPEVVRAGVRRAQERARRGALAVDDVPAAAAAELAPRAEEVAVLNATGVIVHTNLGRSALSRAARESVLAAGGYVALEHDLATGRRAARGDAVRRLLLDRVGAAGGALVVNNGAAALLLATLALPGEVVLARGEMVEIGDGFRLHELLAGAGATVREVGATNRVRVADYASALGPRTGCVLKVHPSNFTLHGFTGAPSVRELAGLGVPLVVDLGSGLLAPSAVLPDEPDASSALQAGASLVTFSTDKLLGGPQGGVVLGDEALVARARRHPVARALRADKLSLAALAATLRQDDLTPTAAALAARPDDLLARVRALQTAVGGEVVESVAVVGGGGAPGVELAGWALALPAPVAERLRVGSPPVVARVQDGRCLVDPRCVAAEDTGRLVAALQAALAG